MPIFVQAPCDEAIIRSKGAAAPCPKTSARWILAATILGSSMAFIDGTVVNVALPALQRSLNATVVDVQWVVEAYSLLLAALLLAGGSLGDRYGRRLIFAIGVALFSLASAWCGFAGSIQQLILARALQGAGGALLVPGSLAIISASFREEARGRAIGTWSGFTAITTAIGPVLGGWLIEHISWQAVFFINLPIALVVLLICFRFVPESRDQDATKRLDWLGAILATSSLGLIVYGLIESSRLGFGGESLTALIAGIVTLVLFLVWETRARNPMLPLTLFRSRNFAAANLLTLFLYGALGGTLFFLPLNLIQVQNYTATAAGAALLPFILIMFLLSRWAGTPIRREVAAGRWANCSGGWIWSSRRASDCRELLVRFFSSSRRAWRWNGDQRCAAHHHCNECSLRKSRRNRIGHQQCGVTRGFIARDRRTRHCDARYV
jgi:EmrB/QacA subfamily drug resistance transporter